MLSPYRIQSNITNKRRKEVSNTILDNNSHREHDLKIPQVTSNDLVKLDTNAESVINRASIKRTKIFQNLDPCMRILKLTINVR